MIKFTPREIQILIRKGNTDDVMKEELKTDSSIETKKAEQEQHSERERLVRPKGFNKMIFVGDGSEYCEAEDEVRTGSSNERPEIRR